MAFTACRYDQRLNPSWRSVLGLSLDKRKYKGGAVSSKASHWRAKLLTHEMTRYAVCDAAVGLAIWQARAAQGGLLPAPFEVLSVSE